MTPTPPHSLEAEVAVLGACLLDPASLPAALDLLHPADFYQTAHAVVFAAMLELFQKGRPVEVVGLVDYLAAAGRLEQAGGAAAISMLPDGVATSANLEYHARLVREKSTLRRVINAATTIIQDAQAGPENVEAFTDEAEHRLFSKIGRAHV
jgi:replicative DNA helicase